MIAIALLAPVPLCVFGKEQSPFARYLQDEAVQKELGLKSEQVAKVTAIAKSASREQSQEKVVAELRKHLSDEQLARLRQIAIQVQVATAIADPALADRLKLTADQKERLKAALEANARDEAEKNDALKRARFASAADRRKFLEKYRIRAEERLISILTTDQKTRFRELMGKPLPQPTIDRLRDLPPPRKDVN